MKGRSVLICAYLLATASPARGQTPGGADAGDLTGVLLEHGRVGLAAIEFERTAWAALEEGDTLAFRNAACSALACLDASGKPADVSEFYSVIRDIVEPCDTRVADIYYLRALIDLGKYTRALEEVHQLYEQPCDRTLSESADIAYLGGVTSLLLRDARRSAEWMSLARPSTIYHEDWPRADSLRMALGGYRPRSPRTAMALGIVPGAGYAYAGYPETALSTLLLVGALGVGAKIAHGRGERGFAGFLVGFGIVWYGGSIYGAGLSADRRNEWEWANALTMIKY